ncbi:MAG: TRAP transporter permease [Bacillota bacterium]
MNLTEPSVQRSLARPWLDVVTVIAVVASVMHIWMNSFSLMIAIKRNALHLAFMLGLTFLVYPARRNSPKDRFTVWDAVLAVLSGACGLYIYFVYDRLVETALVPIPADYVMAIIAVLLVLEGARRAVGSVLPLLAIVFLLYARYGYLLPGPISHRGFSWARILTRMYMTDEGLFGVTLMVSASYVFMFIVFGAFLSKTGTAKFFNDLALSLAGRLRGGPAQVAVFGSAIMGTISGSAQANVVTTGTFTIPLMKSVGYKPYFAGAVEAVASTGGILMPPIMGAAAFMMASFLGVPYVRIMAAGVIPALFYYFAVFLMVDLEAKRLGLRGLPKEQLPDPKKVLLEGGHLLLPIVVIVAMLVKGYTPLYAAFFGLVATVACSFLRRSTWMTLPKVLEALAEGARSAISVGTSCAVVGFIVGTVSMTGLGQVIALNIMRLSMGQLWLALVLVMVAAMVLGMGLPAEACYIVTASVAAPALVKMGVLPLAAHFFVFYYGTLSCVIPPVALTSYTAAGIAGDNPTKVALTGLKLAMAGLIIPYFFVYQPMLLMQDVQPLRLIWAVVSGAIGIWCLASAAQNYIAQALAPMERLLFFAAAVCLIDPNVVTDLVGFVALAAGLAWYLVRTRARGVKITSFQSKDGGGGGVA